MLRWFIIDFRPPRRKGSLFSSDGRSTFRLAFAVSASGPSNLSPRFLLKPLRLRASSGPLDSTSSQLLCNQILTARVSAGGGRQPPLILFNHAPFSGSSALQPFSENSTIDPSLCFQRN